jgi:hypothetical protein
MIKDKGLRFKSDPKLAVVFSSLEQFIAKDCKEFVWVSGMTHVRTSPYDPPSNGKTDRWYKAHKGECIRPGTPLSLDGARRLVKVYVELSNSVRLNSAMGYIKPKDILAGRRQPARPQTEFKMTSVRCSTCR